MGLQSLRIRRKPKLGLRGWKVARVAMCTISVGFFVIVAHGCVSRPPPSPSQAVCRPLLEHVADPSAKRRPSADGRHLFPVRLTDDGEFVERCELTDALQELRAPGPQLAVIYIHGWKHDARPGDTDRLNLAKLLDLLSSREALLPHPRRVVGVYVSWNGQRSDVPILNNLTFWGRKKTADLITQSAIVTKIISAIDGTERKRRQANPAINDVTIYAGHSFGARMLYSAVSQVVIRDVEFAFPDTMEGNAGASQNSSEPPRLAYQRISGVGDLVVLLNPAFEASFYKAFETLVRPGGAGVGSEEAAREKFSSDQLPLMLTLSATTDSATKIAFPIGQAIALNWSDIRRTTLGNYSPAYTHTLTVSAQPGGVDAQQSANYWYDKFCAGAICLVRAPTVTETGDPFIVAQAPPSVIQGHNGIWSENLQTFLVDFISETVRHRERLYGDDSALTRKHD
jgi:hypothetical protein